MISLKFLRKATALALGLGCASLASADLLFTFGYTDLTSSYNSGTATLAVVSSSITDGDVTRIDGATQTALFDAPTLFGGSAAFQLSMSISGVTATTANGSGSFVVSDADGDTITGDLAGTWTQINPFFSSFAGTLSNIFLNDNGATDGTFDGSSSGSFPMSFSAAQPYTGAIVELMFPNGGWFTTNIGNANTLVSAQVVPEPASAAMLIGGLLMGARRIRRS